MRTNKAVAFALAAAMSALASPLTPPAMAVTETVRSHCLSSDAALRLGGCTLVIEDAEETAANRVAAHINRGLAFRMRGAYDRAIEDYNAALRLRPDDPLTLNDRGVALHLKGHIDYAIADFSDAIRINPSYADTYYNRAVALLDKGEAKAAIADFDEAIRRGGGVRTASAGPGGKVELSSGKISPDYYAGRGRANFVLGRYEAAASDYGQAASAQPDKPYFALWRRMAQARAGYGANRVMDATDPVFESAANRLKKTEWPFPVFELYRGNGTPEAVLAAAANPDQNCEALYYVAQWRLARVERQTDGLAALRQVASTCRKDFIERNAAFGELKRLGQ